MEASGERAEVGGGVTLMGAGHRAAGARDEDVEKKANQD